MQFKKPALSYEQQLQQLIDRGLVCADRSVALHYLSHLNYYRLGAYWLAFEADHGSHQFRPGSRFEDVLNLYIFDRELRLLVLDAIERLEVSVRTSWAYHLAHAHGPHAHLDPALFKPDHAKWGYSGERQALEEEVRRSPEVFIRHFRNKYEEPLPPVWATVELMTFGQLSRWSENLLRRGDRNAIAKPYALDESVFFSFLHHVSIIRNICAHHGRLWNRELTFKFRLPDRMPGLLVRSLNREEPRRIYNALATLAYLLDGLSPGHQWKQRLLGLVETHRIDARLMGFPEDFRKLPVWDPE